LELQLPKVPAVSQPALEAIVEARPNFVELEHRAVRLHDDQVRKLFAAAGRALRQGATRLARNLHLPHFGPQRLA
jgi:hypothetical protein